MNLVIMAGDDIGPEIVAAAMAVVKAADAEFSLGCGSPRSRWVWPVTANTARR
jgi:isocitrate/isopropylmalate dehydrogenase